MGNVNKILLTVFIMICSVFIEGFIVLKFWSWFIVPLFNIKPINIALAYGICLFARVVCGAGEEPNNEEFQDMIIRVCARFFFVLPLTLLIGFILTSFI